MFLIHNVNNCHFHRGIRFPTAHCNWYCYCTVQYRNRTTI